MRLDFDARSLYPLSKCKAFSLRSKIMPFKENLISLRATGFDIKQDLSTALVGEVLNLASGVRETIGF